MVEVGDKIFVAPLYGQKDNIAVITGPAGAGAVLNEGDYNTWTKEWCKIIKDPVEASDIPGGVQNGNRLSYFIDDRNDVIDFSYEDTSGYYRHAIFSCADFTNLLVTPAASQGEYVPPDYIDFSYEYGWTFGINYTGGGVSRSVQSYILIATTGATNNNNYLNVYRGSSRLWSRSVWDDLPSPQKVNAYIEAYQISTTGKYILVFTDAYSSPNTYNNVVLYKGSYV